MSPTRMSDTIGERSGTIMSSVRVRNPLGIMTSAKNKVHLSQNAATQTRLTDVIIQAAPFREYAETEKEVGHTLPDREVPRMF